MTTCRVRTPTLLMGVLLFALTVPSGTASAVTRSPVDGLRGPDHASGEDSQLHPQSVPTCSPLEPDSVDQRGSVDVGATCDGSLGSTDPADYYSVNLGGVSAVRLRLFNLPSGTDWDAGIYEDGDGHPLQCHVGTPGDDDKATDCALDPAGSYYVVVERGPEPDGGAYTLSLEATPVRLMLPAIIRRWPPLPDVPTLYAISNSDRDGSYTVRWSSAERAASYLLQEAAKATSPTDGDFSRVYAGTSTSFAISGHSAGRYHYRVKARNSWGDSAWSNVRHVDVLWQTEPQPGDCLTDEEAQLVQMINDYRNANGLPDVPVSRSLVTVAQWHVLDLHENNPDSGRDPASGLNCTMHSWSGWKPALWTAVCYTSDHRYAEGMWLKPREISDGVYTGYGFENAYGTSAQASAAGAFSAWESSAGHRDVILERGGWSGYDWPAMGVGIYEHHAVLWFGDAADPQGSVPTCPP